MTKNVISVCDISAVNVIDGWKLFAICLSPCVRNGPTTRSSSGKNSSSPRWWCCWSTWNAKPIMKFVLGVNIRNPLLERSHFHLKGYMEDFQKRQPLIWLCLRCYLKTTFEGDWIFLPFYQTNRPIPAQSVLTVPDAEPSLSLLSTSGNMFHRWPSFDFNIFVQFDWYVRFRHLCERFRSCLHSSIHFSLVRLRFVQVEFIWAWFDSFLRHLICFLADRFIFARFDLYLGMLVTRIYTQVSQFY